jgi:hypothetical protein
MRIQGAAFRRFVLCAVLGGTTTPAQALNFKMPGDGEATINTTITLGAGWRMENRANDLVGKGNLNPDVCGGQYQSCQGLFRDQSFPAARLTSAPGQFSPNFDDGNWNYDQGDPFSAVAKVTQDITLTWDDYGFFMKSLFFYDAVNNDFTEYHPNILTLDNYQEAGLTNPLLGLPNPGGALTLNPRQYGPGRPERFERRGGELLSQVGTNYQLLDAYFFGKIPLTDEKDLTVKLGRQIVNWGESTLLVINSINQAQPVSASNFGRIGFQVEEVFTPVAMAYASFEPFENATLEGYYQLEWLPVEAPAPGSFFYLSDVIGTDNAVNYAYVHFGGSAEDPEGLGTPQYNPLSGVTPTSLKIDRLKDNEARDSGQYGVAFRYYAEEFNNGTEFAFYFMNYHSKLPYVSTFATQASCARREGNGSWADTDGDGFPDGGFDAYDSVSFLAACPDLPVFAGSPYAAGSDAVPLDTVKLLTEYPEDIKLFGVSFNTTVTFFGADLSLQGEVAYRPDQPLQVDVEDLVFAAFGPTLSRCHDRSLAHTAPTSALSVGNALLNGLVNNLNALGLPVGVPNLVTNAGCVGTTTGIGYAEDGSLIPYAPSDADPTLGPDTFDLLVGHAPGSARSFPAFVTAYRGQDVGENAPCVAEFIGERIRNPQSATDTRVRNPNFRGYSTKDACYIRGWEKFDTLNFILGATHVAGATDTINVVFADQIITLFEVGAMWIPDLPDLDELQIETPGTYTHASAGADGSGANGSRQACSKNPTCVVGPDGLRFNPHQQDRSQYVDEFSFGYDIIQLIRYESVLPGISLAPQLIWKHDVYGNSPGPGENFIKDRRSLFTLIEMRYKSSLSVNLGYQMFMGAGGQNLYRDKDFAQFYVKYQF